MHKDAKSSGGMVMRVAFGVMTCLGTSLAFLMLISALTISGKVGESQTDILIPIVWGLSCLLGTLTEKKNREFNKWLPAYVMAGYMSVLFTCSLLVYEGAWQRPWLPLICVSVGCLLGYKLQKGGSKKRKRHSAAR